MGKKKRKGYRKGGPALQGQKKPTTHWGFFEEGGIITKKKRGRADSGADAIPQRVRECKRPSS